MKTGVEPTPKMSECVSNILQAMDIIQHNIHIMNKPLSQTFTKAGTLCNILLYCNIVLKHVPTEYISSKYQNEITVCMS
jgi:hypothetical protein